MELVGGWGPDLLVGGDGGDRMSGGWGDDTLVGGEGRDVAVLNGRAADYAVEVLPSASSFTVIVRDLDPADEDEGTDELHGMELLRFSDRTVELAPPDPW